MRFLSLLPKSSASFKRQLLSFFIIGVVLLSVITSTITAWQTSEIARESFVNTGLQLTDNFSKQSVVALLTDSEENALDASSRALGFDLVSSVSILKIDDNVLVSIDEQGNRPDLLTDGTKLLANYRLNKERASQFSENENFWLISAPVIFEDDQVDLDTVDPEEESVQQQLLGFVVVEYKKDELHQMQRSIFINNLMIGTVIAFILAILISWGINRLTEPLTNLSEVMKTTKDVQGYEKAEVVGAKEIQRIAVAYNQLMAVLEEQNSQLEKHQSTLKSQVEMRTKELKIARDTALTASRHKSEFLANISHELRTPLQAIIGYTDLVREDLELECMDEQVDDLNKCMRSANSLLSLINNILDIAKIEAGRMDLYLKPVDMQALIDETFETVLPMAAANDNQLEMERGELANTLTFDRQKLMQIFLNLLSNACKFTHEGTIYFSIRNDDDYLYFSIRDTGVGIPRKYLDHIFENFTQVDASQSRKFEGTGLGMAITQNFCELMQGVISVESEEGIGSTFSVKIPVNKD